MSYIQSQTTIAERIDVASRLCGSCYADEAFWPEVLPLSLASIVLCDSCRFELSELER